MYAHYGIRPPGAFRRLFYKSRNTTIDASLDVRLKYVDLPLRIAIVYDVQERSILVPHPTMPTVHTFLERLWTKHLCRPARKERDGSTL